MPVAGTTPRCLIGLLKATAYARNLNLSSSTNMLETTVIEQNDRSRQFIVGQDMSSFSIDGPLDVDPASNGQFDAIADMKALAGPIPISLATYGLTLGSNAWLINAIQSQLTLSSSATATQDWAVTAETDGFTDFNGVLIGSTTAVTADTNGTSVDNGAATANGGVAHLHVTAYSGLTSDSVIIEHSTNDSVWSTLATFTSVTAVGYERLVIAPGTTVNRYLRIRDDVTGTGSIERPVFFARR